MDEIHAQMHYEFVVACIAILLAVRTVVVTMLASTAYNLRRIPDSTYRLDFHVKRATTQHASTKLECIGQRLTDYVTCWTQLGD